MGGSGERWADGCTSGRNASQGEPTAYQARWHRFGVGLDSVRPPELRAVRGSLAFSRWRHASASPSRIGGSGERWADGCTSGRNASQGEPTAYQARWHRFGVGLDSVRPPELRAVRGSLAFSRWRHASASPSRIWAARVSDGRMAAQAGGTQARASLQRIRRGGIASGSAWTVSGRLSYELYAARSRSVGGAMQAHPRQG